MFYTYALYNIRVNSFLFINTELTTLLIHHYRAYSKPLPYVILVTGYNNQGYSRLYTIYT